MSEYLAANEDLNTEEEIDEIPFVEFDISVSPSDPTLELLAQQVSREDIIIPFYQRNYVWKIDQASKLIESFLMGLPVPQVFLYVNDEDQLEVIDGQQRIMSIKYFFEGYFGEADTSGKRQVFKLKGLSEISQYNGKTFEDLTPKDQRKLRNSTLRAINIKQLKPASRSDSVFHIFERLNTGGTQLKPQEIRNAVYRGNIVKELKKLNETAEWQKILGLKKCDKNQKDTELVLRLFSLYKSWEKYEKPMLAHLNKTMDNNRKFDSSLASEFKEKFTYACILVANTIKNPFRPKGVINAAALEAIMIAIMEEKEISQEKLNETYKKIMGDENFTKNISGPTTDTLILQKRISTAKSHFL